MFASKTTTAKLDPFVLSSPPGTDIWRKAPSHNAFNAPTHPSTLPTHPLSNFFRARLTFTLPPVCELRQYDQAGILLHITKPGLPDDKSKWIKSGIEFYNGAPYVATVGCDAWADWSLTPMPASNDHGPEGPGATIEVRREKDGLGKSLWVYWVVGGESRPIREINWLFADEENWEVGIGGYVARPTENGGEEDLVVQFEEGVEVEVLKL